MNKNTKGLLIYPPVQLIDSDTPRPDGSLGLLYLASSLEKEGILTDVLDASIGHNEQRLEDTYYKVVHQENGLRRIGMDFKDIADYVVSKNYDFVGINSSHTIQTRMAFETAKAIKKAAPNIPIFSGGVNARAQKDKFLETNYFDAICLTEGELIFPKAIINGIENTPGFAYKEKNGSAKSIPVTIECFPKHLDDLPMPAWEKLSLEKYFEIYSPHGVDITDNKSRRYASLATTRGCIWGCQYCHVSTEKKDIGRLRAHSIERVLSEVDKLKSIGIEKIFLEDDNPFAFKKRAFNILDGIKDKGIKVLLVNGANIRDYYLNNSNKEKLEIDYKFLEALVSAGFEQIVFPVESGNKRILNKYCSGKVNLDIMNIPELMQAMTNVGIKAPVNLMIGFPDETEQEMFETIKLGRKIKEAGAPYVTFFIPIPFPGSKLYSLAINKGYLDKNFNSDLMNYKIPAMKNTKVPPERLLEIRDWAHKSVNEIEFVKKREKSTIKYQDGEIPASHL
ncbi:MAG: radical SAM protein [Candidatus Pacearchaeota archaeon]|nr:radical SAM protein [Candidatus Pacearchaeota archaeon]